MHVPTLKSSHRTQFGDQRANSHRRLFRTIGIFRPRDCLRPNLENSYHRAIYDALRAAGFQRTVWQYIFDGQITGLVKPGLNDIHIRFYRDRLFAEIEISRALVSHFYGPKYNAREVILLLLKNRIREIEFRFLDNALRSNTIRAEESALVLYAADAAGQPLPYESVCSLQPKTVTQRIMKQAVNIDWHRVGLVLIAGGFLCFLHALPLPLLLGAVATSVSALYALAPRIPG